MTSIFRDYSYHRLRSRTQLKFLIADWGIEKFRKMLETEYLERTLVDCPSPQTRDTTTDHIGVHEQKNNKIYIDIAPTINRVNNNMLTGLTDLVNHYNATNTRFTPLQKIVMIKVEPTNTDTFVADIEELNLSAKPSNWRHNTITCTGIKFCKLAIVKTKQHTTDLIDELEHRFPNLDTPITMNINNCPNAYARTQITNISLKNQLVMDADGRQVESFQIHLNNNLKLQTKTSPFGRKLHAHKMTSAGLDDYITNIITTFLDDHEDGETFAA